VLYEINFLKKLLLIDLIVSPLWRLVTCIYVVDMLFELTIFSEVICDVTSIKSFILLIQIIHTTTLNKHHTTKAWLKNLLGLDANLKYSIAVVFFKLVHQKPNASIILLAKTHCASLENLL